MSWSYSELFGTSIWKEISTFLDVAGFRTFLDVSDAGIARVVLKLLIAVEWRLLL